MERTTIYLALAALLVLGGVGIAGCVTNTSAGTNADTSSASAPHTVYVHMDIATLPNATGEQMDAFVPANVSVPANTTVVFTITNYDDGANPVTQSIAAVQGTVGGTMTVDGKTVSKVDNTTVSHTFTINQGPNGHAISVPIPAATDNADGGVVPTTVTFSVVFHGPGTYAWYCHAPCDPWSMGRLGWMAGNVNVVA